MKNKKKDSRKYIVAIVILVVCLCISVILNFTHTAKLKNGKEVAVKVGGDKITADDLYNDLKTKYAMNVLIDKIDHMLLDSKYKTDDTEKNYVDSQVKSIKANYKTDEEFLSALQSYYGFTSEAEFRDMLSLSYKRRLAVTDYVKENVVTDTEINNYYDTKVIGDVKAKHILIRSNAKDSDSDDEKSKKEEEAKKKAEEIIEKLNNGEDFSKLAKKYSDDEGTASDGGELGYFNTDDNYEEEFVLAAAALENGKYTKEPVKTEYGYEIILKEAEKSKPKLKSVKDTIKETLATEKLQNNNALFYTSLEGYRKKNKVVFKDSSLEKAYRDYLDNLEESASSSSSSDSSNNQ